MLPAVGTFNCATVFRDRAGHDSSQCNRDARMCRPMTGDLPPGGANGWAGSSSVHAASSSTEDTCGGGWNLLCTTPSVDAICADVALLLARVRCAVELAHLRRARQRL